MGKYRDGRPLKLVDLVDVNTLQVIQDRFAEVVNVSTLIRDPDGVPITRVSHSSPFCNRVVAHPELGGRCRDSHMDALRHAAAGETTEYECHAGLVQLATPITVDGQLLGTIVMGDRPRPDSEVRNLDELAGKLDVPPEELQAEIDAMEPWSEPRMRQAAELIQAIASTIALACYRQAELERTVNELATLYEVSKLMAAQVRLQELLDTVTRAMVEVLEVKASSLRLLDPDGKELKISSVHNLSRRYLGKGPVIVAVNEIDQAALAGEVVTIDDVRTDPRTVYPEQARQEGLCSALIVGLRTGERAVGTLRMYTEEPRRFTEDEIKLAVAIANQAAVSIEVAQLAAERRRRRQLDQQMRLAARIQFGLLPGRLPEGEGFEMAVHYRPCFHVGGDYYDFIEFGEHNVGIATGDVAGKNVAAALLMASARGALRANAENLFRVSDIIGRLNNALCKDTHEESFVSLFYGVLDAEHPRLTYTNAGHCPPLLVRDGQTRPLETGGLLLGVQPGVVYEQEQVDLLSGDVVVFYTDGITETHRPEGQLYGTRRLGEAAAAQADNSAVRILGHIRQDVDAFAGNAAPTDDRTVIVLKMR